MFGIKRDITLSDLFDKDKFYYETKPVEKVIDGKTVMRKRYIFFPVQEPEPIVEKSVKKVKKVKPKKVDTFIPLFLITSTR